MASEVYTTTGGLKMEVTSLPAWEAGNVSPFFYFSLPYPIILR
jgi:hypothetical protein